MIRYFLPLLLVLGSCQVPNQYDTDGNIIATASQCADCPTAEACSAGASLCSMKADADCDKMGTADCKMAGAKKECADCDKMGTEECKMGTADCKMAGAKKECADCDKMGTADCKMAGAKKEACEGEMEGCSMSGEMKEGGPMGNMTSEMRAQMQAKMMAMTPEQRTEMKATMMAKMGAKKECDKMGTEECQMDGAEKPECECTEECTEECKEKE